ncbi:hypothetical protein IFM89_034591 [Coptis chinensis]|uniref:RNase H type-1 domain-containing protein n=1 Tax=Coptis chinensis TaxID=261450 RepID=A0A835HS63_9MAGN|nr:hypothetical protein IFM89_034591 [Coptis chinensis]
MSGIVSSRLAEIVLWKLISYKQTYVLPCKLPCKGTYSQWRKPDPDYVKLNTDGSLSPSDQAFGSIARKEDGTVHFAYMGSNSKRFIIQQELMAIDVGLDGCLKHGITKVLVYSDSMNVVSIVNGLITPPWYCQNIVLFIGNKRTKLSYSSVNHCYMETNRAADLLAKCVADSLEILLYFIPPLDEQLSKIIKDDIRGTIYVRF